ncbi:hypothetical protein KY290_031637 [Solanum tuberosum]|uniref:B-like cyclin n=1 Tax=Solanum tuberosum TaxID=4113 RepID=A0ABQ7UBJ1_SOLTU|nr:hypothetical protein KY290_031637 [Solanum tuberosum]
MSLQKDIIDADNISDEQKARICKKFAEADKIVPLLQLTLICHLTFSPRIGVQLSACLVDEADEYLELLNVASNWCFPSPLLKRATEKIMKKKSHKNGPELGPDYLSDLETVCRWNLLLRYTAGGLLELLKDLMSYIAELSLLEYNMFCYAPSLIAASAIFLAKYILVPSVKPWELIVEIYCRRFVRAAQRLNEILSLQLKHLASYIAKLSLLDYNMLCYAPSLIASSAIFLAKYILVPSVKPWLTSSQGKIQPTQEVLPSNCTCRVLPQHKQLSQGSKKRYPLQYSNVHGRASFFVSLALAESIFVL